MSAWRDRKIPKVRITSLSINGQSIAVGGLVQDLPREMRSDLWAAVNHPIRCRVNRVWLTMVVTTVTSGGFDGGGYWTAVPRSQYESERRVAS